MGLKFGKLTTDYWIKLKTSIRIGGYIVGVPPLPIPNREVKPYKADGTAVKGGRVGRRHNIFVETHYQKASANAEAFFVYASVVYEIVF